MGTRRINQSMNTSNVFAPTKPSIEFSFCYWTFISNQYQTLEHCRFALEVDKTKIMQLSQLGKVGLFSDYSMAKMFFSLHS